MCSPLLWNGGPLRSRRRGPDSVKAFLKCSPRGPAQVGHLRGSIMLDLIVCSEQVRLGFDSSLCLWEGVVIMHFDSLESGLVRELVDIYFIFRCDL